SPTLATYLGDRRFDSRLEDRSDEAREQHRRELTEIRDGVADIPPDAVAAEDRITRSALVEQTLRDQAEIDADLRAWTVDPLGGPQLDVLGYEAIQPVRTATEARVMVERWRATGWWFDQHIERLRASVREGRIPVRTPVAKTIEQLAAVLEQPDEALPLVRPLSVDHPGWDRADVAAFDADLRAAVREVVRPALHRYLEVLRDEVLPIARADSRPGIGHLAGGAATYRDLIRVHTSLELEPEAIHEIGLEEVARIDEELSSLGARVLGTADLDEIRARLRTDRAMTFGTPDEVFDAAKRALDRARAAVPGWFGVQPQADCVVVRMLPHEAEHSTIAYYREPAIDGSRPGQYLINTSHPETRPRYEAEALAYHEAVPGHHLQLAISQERTDLPAFRRHLGVTAFTEGWGLYAERLSDEMGLYSSDLDRIGVLSFDGWRASRLVVDTGMHALGWTRGAAIRFMLGHTALAANNIENEVDRYIVWPGQALAYKLGQREILRLRTEATNALGSRFDVRAFHDDVLGHGVLSLPTLADVVAEGVRARS
ncbi:MAG TPA: DUF885 domain-containing protein, partial [Candidatus Limnocylindrales bacterium]|nr:DUF885 domain-containing protein [Candidatus Limnocylindrales bacterium]